MPSENGERKAWTRAEILDRRGGSIDNHSLSCGVRAVASDKAEAVEFFGVWQQPLL